MPHIEERKERFQGLLQQLTDEQLHRLAGVEPHEYDWNFYATSYMGQRCVAGHVFDLTMNEDLYELPTEDFALAGRLSGESRRLPFEAISALTEEELMRRAAERQPLDLNPHEVVV